MEGWLVNAKPAATWYSEWYMYTLCFVNNLWQPSPNWIHTRIYCSSIICNSVVGCDNTGRATQWDMYKKGWVSCSFHFQLQLPSGALLYKSTPGELSAMYCVRVTGSFFTAPIRLTVIKFF